MISIDYCTFGVEAANDAQIVSVNTACAKRSHPKESIKTDTVVSQSTYISI